MSESSATQRPNRVTTAGFMAATGSLLVVLTLFDIMSRVRSVETRDAISEFLATPPADQLGLSVQGTIDLVRGMVLVSGVAAAIALVCAVFVLQGNNGARLGYTVAAALVLLTAPVAGFMALLVGVAAIMLWTRPARDWFAGRLVADGDEQERPGLDRGGRENVFTDRTGTDEEGQHMSEENRPEDRPEQRPDDEPRPSPPPYDQPYGQPPGAPPTQQPPQQPPQQPYPQQYPQQPYPQQYPQQPYPQQYPQQPYPQQYPQPWYGPQYGPQYGGPYAQPEYPQPYWDYGRGRPQPNRHPDARPVTVTVAAWLTWVFSGLTLLVFLFLALFLAVARGQFVDALHNNSRFQDLNVTTGQLIAALWVMAVVVMVWCVVAVVLGVLAFRRSNWARVTLVVSASVAVVVSLLGLPFGLLNVAGAGATILLLFVGGAGDWYARKGSAPPYQYGEQPAGAGQPGHGGLPGQGGRPGEEGEPPRNVW